MSINRWWTKVGLGIGAALTGGVVAWACADGGSGPGSWEAVNSTAILSPANDTRTNFLLLLADRDGTPVADPEKMADGIVPIEFEWPVMVDRLAPPVAAGESGPITGGSLEGSRCQTNAQGTAQFVAAVRARPEISPTEKQFLTNAREAMQPTCEGTPIKAYTPSGLTTPSAREFSAYLVGADEFYRGDWDFAKSRFTALNKASVPWVRETALYMVGRTELNRAQAVSLDEYGSLAPPAERDRPSIRAARAAFESYLQAYPNGRYAGSARGLLRRTFWLEGNRQALGNAYSALLAGGPRQGRAPDLALIREVDLKLLPPGDAPGAIDPILLAVADLLRLRKFDPDAGDFENDYRGPPLARAELEQQRPLFRSDPALFGYLLAAEAYFGRKQPAEVLKLIPDAAHQSRFSYVQFSRQMLRGFALEMVKDRNARGFWLSLLPGTQSPYQREAVELALANHDRRAGKIDSLFAAGSALRHPLIRQHLLEDAAGPSLLRTQAKSAADRRERDVALYLLLAGELHHGLYGDFLQDIGLVGPRRAAEPEGYYGGWDVASYDPKYSDELGPPPLEVFAAGGSNDLAPCPDIRATATSLAANPGAIRPRLCLAEFLRRKGFDGWNQAFDAQYRPIPRARNGFPGQPVERIDIYRSVIASPSASIDDKAFALNRAIRCYEPSGINSCGGAEVTLATRKGWFRQIKTGALSTTSWAKELKYYW